MAPLWSFLAWAARRGPPEEPGSSCCREQARRRSCRWGCGPRDHGRQGAGRGEARLLAVGCLGPPPPTSTSWGAISRAAVGGGVRHLGSLLLREWPWILRGGGVLGHCQLGFHAGWERRRTLASPPPPEPSEPVDCQRGTYSQTQGFFSISAFGVAMSENQNMGVAETISGKHKVCLSSWNLDSSSLKGPQWCH